MNRNIWLAKQKVNKYHDSQIKAKITIKNTLKYGKPINFLNPFPDNYLEQHLDHFNHLFKVSNSMYHKHFYYLFIIIIRNIVSTPLYFDRKPIYNDSG